MTASYPQPGSLLAGRYRLLSILGEGGMGVVFEAQHMLTEKHVALKWMHARVASQPEARQRLVREALITGRCAHPNVVEIHDVVEEEDTLFLVMELLHGETLEELLKRGGTPLHELIALLLPAMRGVAEAHRRGVIHRDIHPGNIFLSRAASDSQVVPKVVDFGISKLDGDESPSLTRAGSTLGTPYYMSYEQLCSARDVDARADVYSFAVILYRAATGRAPFEGESFTELAIKIGSTTPPLPKALRADLPTALERLILWGMERDRDQRIESLDDFVRELEPFASEHSFRAQMTIPERDVPEVLSQGALASVPAPLARSLVHPWRRLLPVVFGSLALLSCALAAAQLWAKPHGVASLFAVGDAARSVRLPASLPVAPEVEPPRPQVEPLASPLERLAPASTESELPSEPSVTTGLSLEAAVQRRIARVELPAPSELLTTGARSAGAPHAQRQQAPSAALTPTPEAKARSARADAISHGAAVPPPEEARARSGSLVRRAGLLRRSDM